MDVFSRHLCLFNFKLYIMAVVANCYCVQCNLLYFFNISYGDFAENC